MSVLGIEKKDHVCVLTLRRAERLNAIDPELLDELLAALDGLHDDLDTRVVVITGAGRGFCAGLDLSVSHERDFDPRGKTQRHYRVVQRFGRLPRALRAIPQPVIAAVNGPAAGGGFSMALASDIRIAAETAVFVPSFTVIGLSGGEMGTSFFLPRLVGSEQAARILYTGAKVTAEQALRIGLVSEVVTEDQALERSLALARELNASAGATSLEAALQIENRSQALTLMTRDHAEASTAFWEHRKPAYEDA
jgi:enoyl-CoA hydratase